MMLQRCQDGARRGGSGSCDHCNIVREAKLVDLAVNVVRGETGVERKL